MITKLTDEQEEYLPTFRENYLKIGVDTNRVDFEQSIKDISDLYKWGDLKPPQQFVCLSSPMMCELYINLITVNNDQLWDQLRGQLRGQLGGQLWDQLEDQLEGQLGDKKLNYMGTCFNGQQDSFWVAYYEFGKYIGVQYAQKADDGIEIWNRIVKSCHWVYPFKDFCLVSDKPVRLQRDEQGRLHSTTEKAIVYSDGWGFCSVHGVIVPDWIVETPNAITSEKITDESNVEVRRVMLDLFGWDRYLIESGAKMIHTSERGTLYRTELQNDEPLVMVKVTNSTPESDGIFKDYFLRVPPTTKTSDEAVAWTFEMDEKDYQPEIQS